MNSENRPKVGLAVLILNGNKVLLGKRKGSTGVGTWAFPGGHLEFGETWEACAAREVFEETGLKLKDFKHVATTNDIGKVESTHYVCIFMQTQYDMQPIQTMEPEKCDGWEWFEWDRLPSPLFLNVSNLVASGYNPFNE